MATFTIHEAKTRLSELIRRMEAGEEIVIKRGSEPVAVLKDYAGADRAPRRPGSLAGQISYTDDAFDPLTDEEIVEVFGQEYFDSMTPDPVSSK